MSLDHHGFRRDAKTGIHTVEGSTAGRRAEILAKKRDEDQAAYEAKRSKIQEEHSRGVGTIDNKFNRQSLSNEALFQKRTVGLVSAQTFRELKRGKTVQDDDASVEAKLTQTKAPNSDRLARLKQKSVLSFGNEEEEAEEELPAPKRLKCPNVETSFLPDRERELQHLQKRERLKREWLELQERVKLEPLEITFSYWDGSGHRRKAVITKGSTIGHFLGVVRDQLGIDFSEIRTASPENLLYIKEDLIIPHHYSFHDLIVSKARGKSGPLFAFDVYEDVRLKQDIRFDKDESHPGKVCLRAWFESNKHIFPASRWEVYDPSIERSARYSVKG